MNSDSSPDRTQDKPPARRRLAGGLLLAMLASWLLMLSPLPYSVLSGVTALAALVLLFPLIVQSIKERRYGMAVFGAALGIPATLLVIGGAAMSVLFYGPMMERQECLSAALTEQARIQCEDSLQGSTAQWVSDLVG